mgnify:CR=1 FL=1
MTFFLHLAFYIATLIFSKRYVDLVKEDALQTASKEYFKAESFYLLRFLIVSAITLLLIMIFKKKILIISLLAALVYAFYIAYDLYLKSEDFIGKNEQYAIRLFSAGKLIGLFTLLCVIGEWLC